MDSNITLHTLSLCVLFVALRPGIITYGFEDKQDRKKLTRTRGGLNADQSRNDCMTGSSRDTLLLNKLVFIIMLASTMNEA